MSRLLEQGGASALAPPASPAASSAARARLAPCTGQQQAADPNPRPLAGNFADAARASNEVYWWKFPQQDCAYDDVSGSCAGKTVAECEALCSKTSGCGGFNYPHGILKKTDCISHLSSSPTVDTYVMQVRENGERGGGVGRGMLEKNAQACV